MGHAERIHLRMVEPAAAQAATRDALLTMLNNHLALTAREATDRIHSNWTDDQQTFDNVYSQAMQMADALSDGIVKQFPTKA